MTELFVRVLQYSLWGGVTAGVILLVKAAVAGRLSPRFHYLIWLVLLAKLLLPGGIESPISPFRLTAPLEQRVLYDAGQAAPSPTGGQQAVSPGEPVAVPPTTQTASPNPAATAAPAQRWTWRDTGAVLWLMGMAVYAAALAAGYGKTRRTLHAVPDDAHIHTLFEQAKQGKLRRVRLMATDCAGPFVFGFFRPVVAVPQVLLDEADDGALCAVLAHELTHIRRLDPPVRLLTLILQGIHWFNPVLWWAFWAMRRDCELACDDDVLRGQDEQTRAAYGRALLAVAGSGRGPRAGSMIAFSRGDLKARIRAIGSGRRFGVAAAGVGLAVVAILLILLLPQAAKNSEDGVEIGGGYRLILPQGYADECELTTGDGALVTVYHRESAAYGESVGAADKLGRLFTLERIARADWPQEKRRGRTGGFAAIGSDDEAIYVMTTPGDVVYSEQTRADYERLSLQNEWIADAFLQANGLTGYADWAAQGELSILLVPDGGTTDEGDTEVFQVGLLPDGTRTLIDEGGHMLYAQGFEAFELFETGIGVMRDGLWGLTDRTGRMLSDCAYTELTEERLGRMPVVFGTDGEGGRHALNRPGGADASPREKYYFYFAEHPSQLGPLVGDGGRSDAKGLTDDNLMAFAIMNLYDEGYEYNYEAGVEADVIDALLIKYFGHTASSYVTDYTEFVPGTDRIRATGWDFHGSYHMVLQRLTEQPDGSLSGMFDVYYVGEMPEPEELALLGENWAEAFLADDLSGLASFFHCRCEINFDELGEGDDFYLRYNSIDFVS